jgi:putative aminopeptidase FrvX
MTQTLTPQLDAAAMDRLFRLLQPVAPSGYEQAANDAFCEVARELGAREVHIDNGGNPVAWFGSAGAPVRRMLTAHLDEIGFQVTKIESSGLIRIGPIGGWDGAIPAGHRVRIVASGPDAAHDDGAHTVGVVARAAVHLLSEQQRESIPDFKDLWVDIGAVDGDDARRFVRVGDPMVIDTPIHMYPSRRLTSRALDDRVCVFLALEAAARADNDRVERVVLGAGTEEIGGFGALVGTYGIRPAEAIAIDVAPTSDVPGDHESDIELGKGPVVHFGTILSQRVGRSLVAIADQLGITVQVEAAGTYTSTDSEDVAAAGPGVVTGLLSVPTRNLHMPGETCDLQDVEQAIAVLAAWLDRDIPA